MIIPQAINTLKDIQDEETMLRYRDSLVAKPVKEVDNASLLDNIKTTQYSGPILSSDGKVLLNVDLASTSFCYYK